MTDRDRLIELIRKQRKFCNNENCGGCGYAKFGNFPDCQNEMLAHQLIENGVIVPPCKVGDVVYFLDAICVDDGYCINNLSCLDCKWAELQVRDIDFDLSMYKELGKTVFLTKEEAKAELRKRGKDNA